MPTGTQGTQAWDRYAFVNNNPVRYNDPTGHMMDEGEGGGSWNGSAGSTDTPDTSGDDLEDIVENDDDDGRKCDGQCAPPSSNQSDFGDKCWENLDCILMFLSVAINLLEIPVGLASIVVPGFLTILYAMIAVNVVISIVAYVHTEFEYQNGEITANQRNLTQGAALFSWIPIVGPFGGSFAQVMSWWTPIK